MFKVEFNTGSAAFEGPGVLPDRREIARILIDLAERITVGGLDYSDPRTVRDVNGNVVGSYVMEPDEVSVRERWKSIQKLAEQPKGFLRQYDPERDILECSG